MDLHAFFQTITDKTEEFFGDNELSKAIAFFIANFLILLFSIEVLADLIPPELDIIVDRAIPLSLVSSLVITGISYLLKISEKVNKQKYASFGITFCVLAIVIVLSLVSAAVSGNEGDYVDPEEFELVQEDIQQELDEIKAALSEAKLTDVQISQIEDILREKNIVTIDQLRSMELTEQQIQQVVDELPEILTREDVLELFSEESTRVAKENANATATAEQSTCYVEPESGFSNVYIREAPVAEEGNHIKYLARGERVLITGHNGGLVNQDRWWLVKLELGGKTVYGWVSSMAVNELNEPACMRLQQVNGS